MNTTQHPLTDTAAAEVRNLVEEFGDLIDDVSTWGPSDEVRMLPKLHKIRAALHAALAVAAPADPRRWRECRFDDIEKGDRVRWALPENDHGTFEMTEGVAHEMRKRKGDREWVDAGGTAVACAPAHGTDGFRYWRLAGHENTAPAEPLARTLLAVPEGHDAPHHDGEEIKPGDYVVQVDEDGTTRGGRAHHQDEEGDWLTEDDRWITYAAIRADRPDAITVWPAPTPPAVEVEMPGEDGAILLDVEALDPATDDVHRSNKTVYLGGRWFGIDSHTGEEIRIWPSWITALTLPDGTRVRRDGERPDGEPRFVKTQEK